MKKPILAAALLSAAILPAAAQTAFNYQHAVATYQRYITGGVKWESLSRAEQAEVWTIANMLRPSAPSDASDECKDAWS